MANTQLSIRSATARALAHELSERERRPIHVIVEEALMQYARSRSHESARQFLERLKGLAVADVNPTAIIDDNRVPHDGPTL